LLARLGGDEFAVVVPEAMSRAALGDLALNLANAVGEPCELDGHRVRSSASIGIAVGPIDGEGADDLLWLPISRSTRSRRMGEGPTSSMPGR
jgi:predicted signal transduction protein with EAL and GGDEF domain